MACAILPWHMSTLKGLRCPECGEHFDCERLNTFCHSCSSPLLAEYDLELAARRIQRDTFLREPRGLWRWFELLPVRKQTHRIALGEGDTPLLHAKRLGSHLGLSRLYIKDEGANPTGSFKARGLCVAVSRAYELGVTQFVIPTAGNAGGALAAYTASAGLEAHVFMPVDAPQVNQTEVLAYGADLSLVDGLIDLAGQRAVEEGITQGWFNVSTFKEPYRVEGKKIMGFELGEAFNWELPEVIIYPTGGGTGLVGMWKAFDELEKMGWIGSKRPRMIVVQASGCAPVVRALEEGDERIRPWKNASTIAAGLRVPSVFADRLILRAVRESGGSGISVSDDEIRSAQVDFATQEGLLACPEGAATLAGLRKLIDDKMISAEERVVLFNTAAGLKYFYDQ
jgi:threonine synthase